MTGAVNISLHSDISRNYFKLSGMPALLVKTSRALLAPARKLRPVFLPRKTVPPIKAAITANRTTKHKTQLKIVVRRRLTTYASAVVMSAAALYVIHSTTIYVSLQFPAASLLRELSTVYFCLGYSLLGSADLSRAV